MCTVVCGDNRTRWNVLSTPSPRSYCRYLGGFQMSGSAIGAEALRVHSSHGHPLLMPTGHGPHRPLLRVWSPMRATGEAPKHASSTPAKRWRLGGTCAPRATEPPALQLANVSTTTWGGKPAPSFIVSRAKGWNLSMKSGSLRQPLLWLPISGLPEASDFSSLVRIPKEAAWVFCCFSDSTPAPTP